MMPFVFSIRIRQHTVYQIDIIHFFSRILFALFYDPQDTGRHIGGVMVSVLDSSAVDRGFDPRSSQAKDYKISIRYALKIMSKSSKVCIVGYESG